MDHFISVTDLTRPRLEALLDLADDMKADRRSRSQSGSTMVRSDLYARTVALIFEKPSLRTRVSFETGVHELGGHSLTLYDFEVGLGRRESVQDTGQVLGRYVHGIVIRTFSQEQVEELANSAAVPVINALTDHEHPCQALADLMTIREVFGELEGLRLAYVGDGNNVAHSLMLGGALAGAEVRLAHPEGYAPDPDVVDRAQTLAAEVGSKVVVTTDPTEAVMDAHVVYTDVWASMGQEHEADERLARFTDYQVDETLMKQADSDAVFLHCLPAHRGEEVAPEVVDGPQSRVFDQAENRLHAQKALLAMLLRT